MNSISKVASHHHQKIDNLLQNPRFDTLTYELLHYVLICLDYIACEETSFANTISWGFHGYVETLCST